MKVSFRKGHGKIIAFFNVTLGDFVMKDFKVVENDKGEKSVLKPSNARVRQGEVVKEDGKVVYDDAVYLPVKERYQAFCEYILDTAFPKYLKELGEQKDDGSTPF